MRNSHDTMNSMYLSVVRNAARNEDFVLIAPAAQLPRSDGIRERRNGLRADTRACEGAARGVTVPASDRAGVWGGAPRWLDGPVQAHDRVSGNPIPRLAGAKERAHGRRFANLRHPRGYCGPDPW